MRTLATAGPTAALLALRLNFTYRYDNRRELIERWNYTYSGSLLPVGRTTSRRQLESVLEQLEHYLAEANLFRANVWKCGSRVFLTGDAWPLSSPERAF